MAIIHFSKITDFICHILLQVMVTG